MVVKKDGRREPFDAAKMVEGMAKACEKRPIAREQLEQAVEEIERQIWEELTEEVPASRIGELVMARLRELDEVAYLRFASVYKEFEDMESFLKEIETLARESTGQPAQPEDEAAIVAESRE